MKAAIRQCALKLGFDDCRFTSAAPPESAPFFVQWLDKNRQGAMDYLRRSAPQRIDPQKVLPGAKSIILLAVSYGTNASAAPRPAPAPALETISPSLVSREGIVARYARYTDYHVVMGQRLAALTRCVDRLGGSGIRSAWFVDTGPILERDLAQRGGLGFVGKHTGLISRRFGNWILLGEILTPLELEPDPPEINHCGSCARCLSACPTQAITAPFQLDARRCISYLTIENKGPIPAELRPAIGTRIFGCDDCLAVCPWNRFAREGRLLLRCARPDLHTPNLLELLTLDDIRFQQTYGGTPLARAKRRGLSRNVCVALGNLGNPTALPALERATADPEPLIVEHARWAMAEIQRQTRSHLTPR
jgi:epoxyqueuosine reductase